MFYLLCLRIKSVSFCASVCMLSKMFLLMHKGFDDINRNFVCLEMCEKCDICFPR